MLPVTIAPPAAQDSDRRGLAGGQSRGSTVFGPPSILPKAGRLWAYFTQGKFPQLKFFFPAPSGKLPV